MPKWLCVTSVFKTPLFIRAETILYIEGFDFGEDSKNSGHRGCRMELLGGQWTTACHCLETVEEVAQLLGIYEDAR